MIANISIATGRIVAGLFFILAGVNKIMQFTQTGDAMADVGLPALLLPLVIALEIGGGLVLIFGRDTRLFIVTALALAVFTLATNAVFHRFWALEEPLRTLELSLFFKNLVIAGALISFAGIKASAD